MNPFDDMRERWLPTDRAVRHARAVLAVERGAELALVPLYQPGKTYGIWLDGQQVVTVPGVVFLAVDLDNPAVGVPTLAWAREAACLIAREQLRRSGQNGTVAYAVVYLEGVAVFEDFADPA